MQDLPPDSILEVLLPFLQSALAAGLTTLVLAVLPRLLPIWSTPSEERDDETHLREFSEAAESHQAAGHAVAVCTAVALPFVAFQLGLALLDEHHRSASNVVIFYGGGLIAICHGIAGAFLGSLIHQRWLAIRYGRTYAENIRRVWRITDERAGGLLGRVFQEGGWVIVVFLIAFSIALLGNRYTVVTPDSTELGRRSVPWTRVSLPHDQVRRIIEKGTVSKVGLFRHRAYYIQYEDGTVLTSDGDISTNFGINDLSDTFHAGRTASAISLISSAARVTPERSVEEVEGITDAAPGLDHRRLVPAPVETEPFSEAQSGKEKVEPQHAAAESKDSIGPR